MDLQQEINRLTNIFISRKAEKNQFILTKESIEAKLASIDVDSLEKVNIVLHKMCEKQRAEACQRLQDLGTYALQYALNQNYQMKIELGEFRKKPCADVYIVKDTGTKTSPADSNGGGVVDIISMALRFVTMQVYEPFIDGPIILDEPCKMVSEEYIPMISNFIKNLSSDFGRQIILCTHNKYLAQISDKQILVKMGEENRSIVEEVPG